MNTYTRILTLEDDDDDDDDEDNKHRAIAITNAQGREVKGNEEREKTVYVMFSRERITLESNEFDWEYDHTFKVYYIAHECQSLELFFYIL